MFVFGKEMFFFFIGCMIWGFFCGVWELLIIADIWGEGLE